MSRAAVEGRPELVGAVVMSSLRSVTRLLVPAAAAIAAFGPLLTRLLFPGTPGPDAHYMGLVLACFAPAVVVYSAQFLVVRGLQALEDTRRPAMIQLLVTGLQILLALLAAALLSPAWVVAGLAASFAVAYGGGLAAAVTVLRRHTGRPDPRQLRWRHLRELGAGVCAGVVGALIADVVLGLWGGGLANSALALGCGLVVLAATYLALNPLTRTAAA